MDKLAAPQKPFEQLYPPISPYSMLLLDVGDGHEIYIEQSGDPNGEPVVVFHGGPGGGSSPFMRRFFDPQHYRIILFDQRGCGHSKPFSCVERNTTWDLVRDIEKIRDFLGIDRWIVFGGSWGATLGLIYAQAYPQIVSALVLRGVFLGREEELEWFYGGGAGRFWPELWQEFSEAIPKNERHDLISAYHARLFCGDKTTEVEYAQLWYGWENALASIETVGRLGAPNSEQAHAFARLEAHYFKNRLFLSAEQEILKNMHKIQHIKGVVVQGRYDLICPPKSAYDLVSAWDDGRLIMVGKAGHAVSEHAIAQALVAQMDDLKRG